MHRIYLTVLTLLLLTGATAQNTPLINTLKERIFLTGYAQGGYTYDDASKVNNTFDIKRIILISEGRITRDWKCLFMYNFNAGGSLLEMYTEYQLLPGLSARIGQFKTPYTVESLISPSAIESINTCSQAVGYLAGIDNSDPLYGPTTGRDAGFMIHGNLFNKFLEYQLAVMNGQGINLKDQNNNKDIAGYAMITPLKGLSAGGSFIKGKGCAVAGSGINPYITPGTSYTRNRWAISAIAELPCVSLRSEYLGGEDGQIKSNGLYATASFHVIPNKIDIITSYDYFNRNTTLGDKQTNYVAGMQYWFYPRCRVQMQYTFRDKKAGEDSNMIQTQVQVRF